MAADLVRTRFTAAPTAAAFSPVLTEAQMQMLQNFVEATLADVLPFGREQQGVSHG